MGVVRTDGPGDSQALGSNNVGVPRIEREDLEPRTLVSALLLLDAEALHESYLPPRGPRLGRWRARSHERSEKPRSSATAPINSIHPSKLTPAPSSAAAVPVSGSNRWIRMRITMSVDPPGIRIAAPLVDQHAYMGRAFKQGELQFSAAIGRIRIPRRPRRAGQGCKSSIDQFGSLMRGVVRGRDWPGRASPSLLE